MKAAAIDLGTNAFRCLIRNIDSNYDTDIKIRYFVGLGKFLDKNNKDNTTIRSIIDKLNKNLSLIEKIKKFKLIDEEFTIENGLMTPTLKLKRKKIIEKYKQELEKLYY